MINSRHISVVLCAYNAEASLLPLPWRFKAALERHAEESEATDAHLG